MNVTFGLEKLKSEMRWNLTWLLVNYANESMKIQNLKNLAVNILLSFIFQRN